METSIAWIYPPPRMQSSQHCEQHDIVLTRFGNPELYKPLFCDWHLRGGGVRSNILILNNPFIHLKDVFGYIWIMNPSRASWGLDPKYSHLHFGYPKFLSLLPGLPDRQQNWSNYTLCGTPGFFYRIDGDVTGWNFRWGGFLETPVFGVLKPACCDIVFFKME